MISVVVVNKETRISGNGFFQLAERLNRKIDDREELFRQELERVYASYGE